MSADPARLERPARPNADGVLLHPKALWSYAHVALYSGYEYNYVVNELSVRPDFPKPIRITGPRSQPRYVAGEIMDWFQRHQERERPAS